jgi:hypothetical protein
MTLIRLFTGLTSRARTLVTANLGLKLISIALAALLQLVVQRDSVKESELAVPLVITHVAKNKVFVGEAPDAVKVRVRGRRTAIQALLREHSGRLAMDLAAYRDGERYVFDPRTVEVQLGNGHVEVLGVEPPSLLVRLDQAAEVIVPVEVPVSGEPAAGFKQSVKGVIVEPAKVKVFGPASQVKLVRSVRTNPLDLHGADHDIRMLLRLVPPGDRRVQLSVEEVAVDVPLDEREIVKTLEKQPIAVRGCPIGQRCVLDPPDVSIRVEGLARAVGALIDKPPMNLVFADVSGLTADAPVKLAVHPLAGVTLTLQPAVAKWSMLRESPPPPATLPHQ